MSVTCFCPSCWNEVATASVCPACGTDIQSLADESYEKKLIRALNHPEPTVPIRAAAVLGELGSPMAVEPLIDIAQSGPDPYIQEAAVEALGQIGDTRAFQCLERLSREGVVRVRAAAERAIKTLESRTNTTQG